MLLTKQRLRNLMAAERDEDLKNGARAVAADLGGPAGQIALDRVVRHHLAFFDMAQVRGLSWPQISRLLYSVGAGRSASQPFTPAHLSAVVWRQRKKASDATASVIDSPLAGASQREGFKLTLARRDQSKGATSSRSVPTIESGEPERDSSMPNFSARPQAKSIRTKQKKKPDDAALVREIMRRATEARKIDVDDG